MNPWEEIDLTDYEKHMSLASVKQLQALNEMMKAQFYRYPVSDIMILGIAGGNGLEHIDAQKIHRVYGVDINKEYLTECLYRYPDLSDMFSPLCVDLLSDDITLPHCDLIVADLVIEYIGYDGFLHVAETVEAPYISCIIQGNMDEGFVSDSPYLHSFDGIAKVHHEIEEDGLTAAMQSIGYGKIFGSEYLLPNGKKLVCADYVLM
ncbi:hypothetical protein EDD76_12071 [Kineothrix alysoides]|uniref:Methyltransferase family protein n=1 Tax=Kineothrix alysoides TaxID=1469948 RepID=A0A4R1QMH9_9FIRM|nr:methyltransferase type 11 [Kineothrix alysoides]TCL54467.1 hypothetical protein EDD76_12071 [Kineothrix alysoides]